MPGKSQQLGLKIDTGQIVVQLDFLGKPPTQKRPFNVQPRTQSICDLLNGIRMGLAGSNYASREVNHSLRVRVLFFRQNHLVSLVMGWVQ